MVQSPFCCLKQWCKTSKIIISIINITIILTLSLRADWDERSSSCSGLSCIGNQMEARGGSISKAPLFTGLQVDVIQVSSSTREEAGRLCVPLWHSLCFLRHDDWDPRASTSRKKQPGGSWLWRAGVEGHTVSLGQVQIQEEGSKTPSFDRNNVKKNCRSTQHIQNKHYELIKCV